MTRFTTYRLGWLVLVCLFGLTGKIQAQKISRADTLMPILSIGAQYSFQLPFGDLNDRFGTHHSLGLNAEQKFANGWLGTASFTYQFGNSVKDTGLLRALQTPTGEVINADGDLLLPQAFMRGFRVMGSVGRVWPVLRTTANSGLTTTFGVGLWQHRIRHENIDAKIFALNGDYEKGYDRLTNGLALSQTIGYTYYGRSGRRGVNFRTGVEVHEGFTKVRRSWDFATNSALDEGRLDIAVGLYLGWLIPLGRPERGYGRF
jgi:voltage-gated potassium channel Kch